VYAYTHIFLFICIYIRGEMPNSNAVLSRPVTQFTPLSTHLLFTHICPYPSIHTPLLTPLCSHSPSNLPRGFQRFGFKTPFRALPGWGFPRFRVRVNCSYSSEFTRSSPGVNPKCCVGPILNSTVDSPLCVFPRRCVTLSDCRIPGNPLIYVNQVC